MSNIEIFGYARVSSKDQKLNRQIDELKKYVKNEENILFDEQSGKDLERPGYKTLCLRLRKDDILYITELDRLGRNKNDIKEALTYFKKKGVIIRILDIPTTLMDFKGFGNMQKTIMDMVNSILIEVLSTQAQQEREKIRKRQAEGIQAARLRGKHLGRPKMDFPKDWYKFYSEWKAGERTAVSVFKYFGMSKNTFYRMVKNYEKHFDIKKGDN